MKNNGLKLNPAKMETLPQNRWSDSGFKVPALLDEALENRLKEQVLSLGLLLGPDNTG